MERALRGLVVATALEGRTKTENSPSSARPFDRFKPYVLWSALSALALASGFLVPELIAFAQREAATTSEPQLANATPKDAVRFEPKIIDFDAVQLAPFFLLPVVVLGGIVWFLRRRLSGKTARADDGGLHTLETLTLGHRCLIYLVKAGDAELLAGVDRSGLKAVIALPPHFESALEEAAENESSEEVDAAGPASRNTSVGTDPLFLARFQELLAARLERRNE
jgi:flagellar biogenesis protein FliO